MLLCTIPVIFELLSGMNNILNVFMWPEESGHWTVNEMNDKIYDKLFLCQF